MNRPRIRRSSRAGRLLGAAVIGVLGCGVLLGAVAASPAAASPASASAASATPMDAASFSRDGVHFAADPQGALFAGLGAIVPGQRETARLWVRNDGPSPLVIRVNATQVSVDDADYADALSLRATTTAQPTGELMTFSTTETCFMLLGEQYLQPGATIPITFRLSMADVDGSLAQSSTAGATVAVGLRDATSPWLDDAECDGDGAHLPVLGEPEPTAPPTPPTPTPTVTPEPEPTASTPPTAPPAPAGASGPTGPTGPSGDSLSSTGTDAVTWLTASVALIAGGLLAVLLPHRSRRRRTP